MRSLPLSFARSWLLPPSKARCAPCCALRSLALVHFTLFSPPVPQLPLARGALFSTMAAGAGGAGDDVQAVKQALRKELRCKLASLEDDAILRASGDVAQQLFALPEFTDSKGVACFLSMPKEFNTRPILERLFQDGKRVYLPRVESVKEHTMSMLETSSLADLDAFPPGRWNIPEPPRDGPSRVEACEDGSELDLIVVPGLAFDKHGGRLGQGAGFYDRYLAKIQELKGNGKVKLVGVTIDELMVDKVPRDDLDFLMDKVLWPSKASTSQ
jgi:5-formyltetrahydrofolate cyclo-ligase